MTNGISKSFHQLQDRLIYYYTAEYELYMPICSYMVYNTSVLPHIQNSSIVVCSTTKESLWFSKPQLHIIKIEF